MKTNAMNSQRELVRGSQIVEKNKDENSNAKQRAALQLAHACFFSSCQILQNLKRNPQLFHRPAELVDMAMLVLDQTASSDMTETLLQRKGTVLRLRYFNVQKSPFARDSFPSRKFFDTPARTREKREDQRTIVFSQVALRIQKIFYRYILK